MTTHSFTDHLHALALFLKAKEELRFLVEHGIEATQAFDLIVRSYTYNPLMLRYYAPTLHAWALKPVPPPPTPEPVKTYFEELQAALERIAVLEHEQIAKKDEGIITPTQTVTTTSDSSVATPAASGNGSSIPPGSLTAVGASPDPDREPTEEITPNPQAVSPLGDSSPQEIVVQPQEVIEAPAPPAYDPDGAILGRDVETGQFITIGEKARQSGIFIIGGNGTGKSTVVVQALLHDAEKGLGFFFLDPHGSGIEQFLLHCPAHRLKDVILIEPGNTKIKHSIGLNLITRTPGSVDADAARLMDVFKRLWGPESGDNQSWGPRMENLLRSSIYVFLALGLTLAELPHFLKNSSFRKDTFSRIAPEDRNIFLEDFWETDYEPLSKHEKEVWAGPLMNKLFALLTAPEVMKIIAQPQTTIDFRKCMDEPEPKIILVHLNENLIGRDAQHFIGTTLIAELIKSVRSRSPEQDNLFFTIAIDEFAKFASSEFVEAVPELRKYGCGFLLLSQFFHQLETDMQGAVKQMATQITFRVAPDDAALRAWLYYRDPKPITREVEKKLPAQRPIDHLVLAGRSHNDELVTKLCYFLEPQVRSDSHATVTTPGGATGYTEFVRYPTRKGERSYTKFHKTGYIPPKANPNTRILGELNRYFNALMVTKNPRLIPFPHMWMDSLSRFMGGNGFTDRWSFNFRDDLLNKTPELLSDEERERLQKQHRSFPLFLLSDEEYDALWLEEDDALPALFNACRGLLTRYMEEEITQNISVFQKKILIHNNYHPSELTYSKERYVLFPKGEDTKPLLALATYTYHIEPFGTDPTWYGVGLDNPEKVKYVYNGKYCEVTLITVPQQYAHIEVEKLKRLLALQLIEWDAALENAQLPGNPPTPDELQWDFTAYDERQCFWKVIPPQTVQLNTASMQYITKVSDLTMPKFEETIRAGRSVAAAIATDPILVGTGEMEEIVTGKQPVQDAVNEMAGNIIDLPNYTAYVRLPPNGGLGETDTAYKPRMETLPLPAGVDETILPERKKQAHNQTLAQGFATPTKTILQDIADRRARFGIGTEGKQQPKQEPKEKPQQQDLVQEDSSTKGKRTFDEKASPNGDLLPIGNKLTEEKQPQSAEPVVTPAPVVAPALLQVSRAGTYAATTLPLTPHPVALPAEKTTPDSYAALLYHFAYLSLEQATLLTGKGSSIDYERKKINKLIVVENKQVTDKGLITSQPDKSSDSSGKAKLCYSLTAKGYKHLEATQQLPPRKKGNLAADTLAVNDALITLVLAARTEQSITLVDLLQEKVFEQSSIKLPDGKELSPDGLLTFRVNGAVRSLLIECDSGSEQKSQIVEKVTKFLQVFQGPYQERTGGDSVTVVFCIPGGLEKDVARLVGILEAALKQHKEAAPLFLVGVLPDGKAIPDHMLTQTVWSQPFSPDKHALIA